jgi:hypothetical protein
MGKSKRSKVPRTFFLNETHELGRGKDRSGGGGLKLAPTDWSGKGQRLNETLDLAIEKISESKDPLKQKRFFFVAKPEETIEKVTKAKKYPTGIVEEETDFSKKHAQTFGRLGLDLIEVTAGGDAVVHATPDKVKNLQTRASSLGDLGAREQARWARVKEFATVPIQLRLDDYWISKAKPKEVLDVVIELQPVLDRLEADAVFRSIAGLIAELEGESLLTNGKDFSGRHWLRGNLSRKTVQEIAKDFYSVQSLHDPLYSTAAAKTTISTNSRPGVSVDVRSDVNKLPVVAVFDTGVPEQHHYLAPFRSGEYRAPAVGTGVTGTHGSKVASRIVFGEQDFLDGLDGIENILGECRFIDVNVADATSGVFGGDINTIDDKSVPDAMAAIVAVYREARVFNFSFSAKGILDPTETTRRREQMRTTQDVDNFVFEHDVIIAVCSGNSPSGIPPSPEYPGHFDDPNWQIGHWASGFNTVVAGAYADRISADAIAKTGWPSPFSRIGPGQTGSPAPIFSAPGGNRGLDHRSRVGLGVSVCSDTGNWEDASGTSFAVPITAREAAFTLKTLGDYCTGDMRPFGVTAKAFLSLTARHLAEQNTLPANVRKLAARTLGRGKASASRIENPAGNSAVFIWQGVLENPRDRIQVQFPIPTDWYENAEAPMLRLACSADVPVNEAVSGIWACRKVTCKLRVSPEAKACSRKKMPHNQPNYPLSDRLYDLKQLPDGVAVEDDLWIIELEYEEIADYPAGQTFSPQQRVAFACELYDASEAPLSPQEAIQNLPVSTSMTFLSISNEIKLPIIIRQ